MVFTASICILVLYFVRPQDWIPGLAGFNVIRPVIAIGIFGLMSRTRTRRGPLPLRFMRTPHEWLMLVYLLYMLFTSADGPNVFSELLSLGLFFFIAMHGISSGRFMLAFINWWKWLLVTVVVMGLGTLYGFDFTQSSGATAEMHGRLCLRHWMLDNPNALGHTLVTLLPLLYFTMFKSRPIPSKILALLIATLTGVCLWQTQSKGAYLVGAAVLLVALLLGRPWWFKGAMLAIAIGGGQTALSTLPRMSEMGALRQDEGVVGRLMAWEIARGVTKHTLTGEGWKKFAAVIDWEGERIDKATHSSYVKVGADLGIPGLLLYLSLLCCGLRSLLTYGGYDARMEKARCILLCLLLSYIGSGWMIDRAYHTEFFLLLGAIASYHALSVRHVRELAHARASAEALPIPLIPLRRHMQRSPILSWRTYGVGDAIAACVALQLVLSTWDYVILNL